MRLKIFNYLEERIIHNVARRSRDLNHASIINETKVTEIQSVIDYRLRFGARVPVDKGDEKYGRIQVVRLLAREIYGDIFDEIADLREWVFENGIGKDVESKLTRILMLLEGEYVPLEQPKEPPNEAPKGGDA